MNSSTDKHDKIMQAAIKVFARKGFYNSKISEIAREADVADGTIYLYFKNKDDLLIKLFEESMDGFIKVIRKDMEKMEDAAKMLRHLIELHLSLIETNPALAEVITVELRQSSKFMKEYRNIKFKEYLKLTGDIIAKGKEEGVFKKDISPTLASRMLFGALDEVSLLLVMSKKKAFQITDTVRQVAELFITGILNKNT
jgi:TetR/AcrR family fatty acid metabolism transcriptional regulator